MTLQEEIEALDRIAAYNADDEANDGELRIEISIMLPMRVEMIKARVLIRSEDE